jgi:hypothetical protein
MSGKLPANILCNYRQKEHIMELQQLYDLRARVLRGETVTDEELAEAIKALRVGRQASGTKSETKAKTPKIEISIADLIATAQKNKGGETPPAAT